MTLRLRDRVAAVAAGVFGLAVLAGLVLIAVRLGTGSWPGGAFVPAPMIPVWALLGGGSLSRARSTLLLAPQQWRRTGVTGWVLAVDDVAAVDLAVSARGTTFLRLTVADSAGAADRWRNRIWQSHVLTGIPRRGNDLLLPLAPAAVESARDLVHRWPDRSRHA